LTTSINKVEDFLPVKAYLSAEANHAGQKTATR
jgi:hypothetical protein